ncbi:hypothetical protein [Aureimonas sp. AU22]|uniref:hypothetical protein n=1 Tax=Aureimonas sp. AU22 TaxID=1638162 RepID=UPI0012E38DD3|nr:hypothetical protein [Aureimonas sp. AU22]
MIRRPYVLVLALPLTAALAGCQTVEEAATKRTLEVCTGGGHGPGTRYHDYCMSQLKPVAVQVEQQRRQKMVTDGVAMMAQGLNPPPPAKLTCIQDGNVTRCY